MSPFNDPQGVRAPHRPFPPELTPAPPSEPTTEPVPMPPSTGWKPNFTKPNPWEGMPQEYVEREAAVFKPTKEQPLPPSQRTPEGLAAREAAPAISAEKASIKLAPESTPSKPLFSQEDYDRFQKLQDREKFVKAVELGLIPEGSKYAPGLKVIYGEGIPEEERRLEPREWGYYSPEQVAVTEAAKAEVKASKEEINAALAKLSPYKTEEGYELQKAFDEGKGADVYAAKALGLFTDEDIIAAQFGAIKAGGVARDTAEFEAKLEEMPTGLQLAYKKGGAEEYNKYLQSNYTELSDKQWIDKEQLARLETEAPDIHKALITSGFSAAGEINAAKIAEFEVKLKDMPFDLQEAYAKGGFELYEKSAAAYTEALGKLAERRAKAMATLEEYKVTSFSEGRLKDEIAELTELYTVTDIRKKRDEIAAGAGGDITTWDVPRYLLDNPGNIITPISAGFDRAYVEEIDSAVKASKSHWVDGKLQVYEAYIAGVSPQVLKTLTGLEEKDIKGLRMPLAEFIERYEAAHPVTPEKTWLPLYGDPASEALRKDAMKAYAKIYGRTALAVAGSTGIATVLFAPARALEPRVKLEDIKPLEWGIGAAQVILYASPLWLPRVIKVAPKLNPVGKARVVMADGSTKTIWKGVKFWDTPVIGKSGSKLLLGTKGMQYPELAKIAPGWKPVTGLETKIMASRKAMQQMGFADTDIARVMSTLQARGTFVGQQSQYITREMLTDPIKTLNKEGVEAILKQASIEGKNIKVWYGSTSIKQQLAPKLRTWRVPADIDIQTTLNLDDTISLTNRMLAKLKLAQGAKNVRISAKSPTLIETLSADGKWHHAVDIHALGDPTMSSMLAGEGAYGRLYAESPVTVQYGNSNIKIMSLSESGVRKAGSILEWREGIIQPATHRTKDIVDYYVILQSYNGDDVANAWALSYGYDPTTLAAMAADTSAVATSWMYVAPSASVMPPTLVSIAPLLTVTSPSITSAALSMPIGSMPSTIPGELPSMVIIRPSMISAELASISKISPPSSVVSPKVFSQAVSQSVSVPSVSPSVPSSALISPTISPPSAVPSKAPSLAPSAAISPPSVMPSVAPSVVPSPVVVSPSISPIPSPPISPSVISPYPYEPPPPPPPPPPPSSPIDWLDQPSEWLMGKKVEKGTVAWRQGLFWIIMPPPYTKRHYSKKPPEGAYKFAVGEDSAYKTIQVIGGMPKKDILDIDIGIAIVDIKRKDKKLTIHFKRDVKDVYKGKTATEKIPKLSIGKPRKARQPRTTYSTEASRPKKQVKLPKVATINDRFYLGHRLRPSELKVTL